MNIYELEKYEKIVRRLHRDKTYTYSSSFTPESLLKYYAYEKFVCDRVLYYLKSGVSLNDLAEKLMKRIFDNKKKQEEERIANEEKKKKKTEDIEKNEVEVINNIELSEGSLMSWLRRFYK